MYGRKGAKFRFFRPQLHSFTLLVIMKKFREFNFLLLRYPHAYA
jgi:hypothetical protein